jgi:hypothetical protein
MMVLIGLVVLLCLVGAWAAVRLEKRPRHGGGSDVEEGAPSSPWSHVEQGPDSFYPSGRENKEG